MLLLLLTVYSVLFGFCIVAEEVCYGKNFQFSFGYTPPLYKGPLYFTPSNGGPRKMLMDNGKAIDPRLRISYTTIYLHDLTEEDDGYFSISFDEERLYTIATLNILDCAKQITRNYGYTYEYILPRETDFIEFTPIQSLNQRQILWNRTDPEINTNSHGRVKNNLWKISDLTQKDSGYYNFRKNKNNYLVSRINLKVEELTRDMEVKEGNVLHIVYPYHKHTWAATFTPEGETDYTTKIAGGQVLEDLWFNDRIQCVTDGIEVAPAETEDSGVFDFRDSDDNLVLRVRVEVKNGFRTDILLFILTVVIMPMAIICCCCYCCKKKCCREDKAAPQTPAAPTVYNHDDNQHSGPSYSAATSHSAFSYQPVNPSPPREHTAPSYEPPAYQPMNVHVNLTKLEVHQPLNVHVNPTQPEVAPPGMWESTPVPPVSFDCLSSGNEPQFELNGLRFTSATPLSSGSTLCDVYTSDKLNFL